MEIVAMRRARFNAHTAVGKRVASCVGGPKARNGRGVYAKTLATDAKDGETRRRKGRFEDVRVRARTHSGRRERW
jgi:hypothetical protein